MSDKISNIFSDGFSDYKSNPPESEWLLLQKKMRPRNFLRFNPVRFNVFYLAIFVSLAGFSAGSVVKVSNFKESLKEKQQEILIEKEKNQLLETKIDSLEKNIQDTAVSIAPEAIPVIESKVPKSKKNNKLTKMESVQEKPLVDTNLLELPVADTLEVKPKPPVTVKKVRKKVIVKKGVVIKDTIRK